MEEKEKAVSEVTLTHGEKKTKGKENSGSESIDDGFRVANERQIGREK